MPSELAYREHVEIVVAEGVGNIVGQLPQPSLSNDPLSVFEDCLLDSHVVESHNKELGRLRSHRRALQHQQTVPLVADSTNASSTKSTDACGDDYGDYADYDNDDEMMVMVAIVIVVAFVMMSRMQVVAMKMMVLMTMLVLALVLMTMRVMMMGCM